MGLDDRDYMRARYRRRQGLAPSRQSAPARQGLGDVSIALAKGFIIAGLAVLTPFVLTKVYTDAITEQFQSMIPVPFPKSGSVYVPRSADLRKRQGFLRFTPSAPWSTGYFVLLHDIEDDRDVLGIYLHGGDAIGLPVPVGRYRLRVASGNVGSWRGMGHLFGRTVGRELVGVLSVSTNTDRAVDLESRVSRDLGLKPNSNAGFMGREG